MTRISSKAIIVGANLASWPHQSVLCKAVYCLILFVLLKQGVWRTSWSIICLGHNHSFWILSGWAVLNNFSETLQFILTTVDHTGVIIYMLGLSSSIIRLLEWVLDFPLSKRDFIDLFVDKVGENSNSFPILSINNELTAARVLVEGDKWTPIWLRHNVKLLLDYVDVSGLYGVRIPNIVCINDKFRRNLVEEPMRLMVLIHVALHVWAFLEVKVCIGGRGLSAIYLSLSDHLSSFGRCRHLYGFEVVQSDVAFWLPLAQILVKAVVITCHVVEEDAIWLEVVQYLRSLILINGR